MTARSAMLDRVAWPTERLGEGIEALSRQAGLSVTSVASTPPTARDLATEADLAAWIDAAAAHVGLEASLVDSPCSDVEAVLGSSAPCIVTLPGASAFVAITEAVRDRLKVMRPDLTIAWIPREVIAAALIEPLAASVTKEIDATLDAANVPARRRDRAHRALLAARLSSARIAAVHALKEAPGGPLRRELGQVGVGATFMLQLGAHVGQLLLVGLATAVIGRALLSDHLERSLLVASIALLVSAIPLQLLEQWYAGLAALEVAGVLKQRLLVGTLRLTPEEVRAQGSGDQLGRVIEADALHALAMNGGASALMSLVELFVALVVLARGAGGVAHAVLLAVWCLASTAFLAVYVRARRAWTTGRLVMSARMVERLVGYETRLAQERLEAWHKDEDRELEGYQAASIPMDRALRRLLLLQTRGWLLVGLVGLAPAFVRATASPAELAVGVAGVLLANAALAQLARGLTSLVDAGVSVGVVAPLFRAAARREIHGAPEVVRRDATARAVSAADPLLEAHDLSFRYRDAGEPVISPCNLTVRAGDRLLIDGDSGAGKSTLAAVLAGLRAPSSGLVLSRGLDAQTLGGDAFRRRIVLAPQFHENHIFGGSLAFNLLMGRRWPPAESDLAQAEQLCRELDLGDLIERMPSGLETIVGETGWRLSHGEKSRVYIARALLQNADVVILDESFGALDPATLERSVRCVLERATATVIIAHVEGASMVSLSPS